MTRALPLLALLTGLSLLGHGCGSDGTPSPEATSTTPYAAQLVDTLLMGSADNAEVVAWVPGADRALLVSSKARKVSLLEVSEGQLTLVDDVSLFSDDASAARARDSRVLMYVGL